MRTRVVAVLTACLLQWQVRAQDQARLSGPRVRITAATVYEIPGVVRIQPDRVSGKLVELDEQLIQITLPNQTEPIILLTSGQSVVGRAVPKSTLRN